MESISPQLNELCRMRLDVSMLDELVHEYCVYRGIVETGLASPSARQTVSETSKLDQPEAGYCSSRNCSLEVDSSTRHSDGETCASNNTPFDSLQENTTDVTSLHGSDVEVRYACESAGSLGDCSTSGSHMPENSRVLLRNRGHATGERSKRKRWRGRCDELGDVPDVSFSAYRKQEASAATAAVSTITSNEQQSVENVNKENKYEIVLGMRELASRGMASDVVEEINAMDPSFFAQNPILLFQLKQVEFLKLVSSGDHSGALRVACTHLGPLAASDPALLKPLKETPLALRQPNEDALGKGLPLHALATSLQVAVSMRLGVEEPLLMRIMRATLHTHVEWFKLQMCKDRFESLPKIDSLKENSTPLIVSSAISKSNTDSCSLGSSQVTISSSTRMSEVGSSPNQALSRDICDENAILKSNGIFCFTKR